MSALRLLALSAALGVAAPAFASPRAAALVPLLKPAGAPELRDRFQDAVTRGATQGGLDAIPAAEVRMRLGASDELMNCAGPGPCAARAGMQLHADVMIASEIGINGKDYAITLHALDAAGRELQKVSDSCDICTVKEADDAVARAAQKLATLTRALATATPPPVTTTPPPAVTTAPPPAETAPPPTETAPPVTQTAPPATQTAPMGTNSPVSGQISSRPSGPPWKLIAGISLGVVGIVGIAVGAYLVSIDGNPTCDSPDPMHSCPQLYNTVGGGGTLIALGIASLGGAGALLYLHFRPMKSQAAARVMITPLPGGVMAGLGGRF